MNAALRLKYLVQLALVDNTFDDDEMKFIVNLGRANGMSEEEINSIIRAGITKKETTEEEFSGLSFDERLSYLVSVIELMKVDGKIYLSEINYCKTIAEKLGFKREVVSKATKMIHSDRSLTMDWEALREELKGLQKKV